jgi:hypothetical protein
LIISTGLDQLLAYGRLISPGTPASPTNKTGRHDIAEILLKVALNTINQIKSQIVQTINKTIKYLFFYFIQYSCFTKGHITFNMFE